MADKLSRSIPMYAVKSLVAALIAAPILYAFSISLMSQAEVSGTIGNLIPAHPNFDNYRKAVTMVPFASFLGNSLCISICVTLGQLVTCSLAAYAFTFFDFPGKKILFLAVLATVMIPGEVIIVSNYLTVSKLGWNDTKIALVAPFLASGMGIFMVRQFYMTIPRELKEAATIDGCGSLGFFCHVIVPVSTPILASLGIYTFIMTWNQYVWPLLVTNTPENRTVQIGISMLLFSEGNNYELVLAGALMIIVPSLLVFFIGQKRLVDGMVSGAVKG
jgi:sn-glycerol 3-phosphate transport system permease protein